MVKKLDKKFKTIITKEVEVLTKKGTTKLVDYTIEEKDFDNWEEATKYGEKKSKKKDFQYNVQTHWV